MAEMFQSARLTYKALETPDDDDFWHSIQLDNLATANSTSSLQKPPSKAQSNRLREQFLQNTLLGVIICITPTSPDSRLIPIGQVHLSAEPPNHMHHRHSEIGVDIIAAYQGRGYGGEAIKWMMDYGFTIVGLHRIEIRWFSWNPAAGRLYERLGFVKEGVRREVFWHQGGWGDEIIMGILEPEWRAIREKERSEADTEVLENGIRSKGEKS